ncbi:MAG TPA: hypothetical protein VGM53_15220 [Streptosporangiaceae bacterium]
MDISVVAAAREDDTPPLEALAIAANADRLDEIAICPATTGDPGGERTLTAISALR